MVLFHIVILVVNIFAESTALWFFHVLLFVAVSELHTWKHVENMRPGSPAGVSGLVLHRRGTQQQVKTKISYQRELITLRLSYITAVRQVDQKLNYHGALR